MSFFWKEHNHRKINAHTYENVKNLYKEAIAKNLLDKVEPHTTTLMLYMGYKLNLSYGDQTNIKITTKEDVEMLRKVFSAD